ncbi:glycoside hydrolase family 172 protein [Salegentibacter agarivorans]
MKNFSKLSVFLILIIFVFSEKIKAQELYEIPENTITAWSSFENPGAEKGSGGIENKGAKGHAFNEVEAGKSVVLLDVKGSGVVNRIWMTFSDRSPEMLRSLVIEMYWDNAEKPAVTVPIGDFFGIGLGERVAFESTFFSDPEERSFNCYIPMPFKTSAKIIVRNESAKDLKALFYDVNFIKKEHTDDTPYFHAYWNRENKTKLKEDFEILPKVKGKGRFLGANIGVITANEYEDTWWGEGEVKMYIDGDSDYPSLIGSGTEDYIGTAYGQGAFAHRFQGSPVANTNEGKYAFYRYHVPDPVYFYDDIRITVQQMGGGGKEKVKELIAKGADLIPVTIDPDGDFVKLLEMEDFKNLNDPNLPKGWTNFFRSDDVSATAYFYLDKPVSELPKLPSIEKRVEGLN